MADVFISYSRKDNDDGFVSRLFEALEAHHIDAWMDRQDIPPAFDFLKEIYPAIETTNYFLFVISPHSVESAYCRQELEQAAKLNKRLLPVVRCDTDIKTIPPELSHLNWIWCREGDDFESALNTAVNAIRSADQDYVHFHTRLLTRAREWDSNGRNSGFALRGRSLQEAETWLAKSGNKEPRATLLQSQYIAASRQAAVAFQRVRFAAVTVGFVIALILALAAILAEGQAVNNAQTAIANAATARVAQGLALNNAATATIAQGQAQNNALTALANANTATVAQGKALNNAATATIAQGQAQNNALTAVANANTATVAQGRALNNAATATIAQGQAQNNALTAVANANTATVAQGQAQNNASTATFLQAQAQAEAQRQANIALSRQLAAQAIYRRNQPDIPVLLSLEANRIADTVEARQSLLEVLKPNSQFSTTLVRQAQAITSVAFSPDGSRLALGTRDGFIRIWDMETGHEIGGPYHAYSTAIIGLAFDQENRYLISSAQNSSQLFMWSLDTWTSRPQKSDFSGKTPITNAGAFSPDGTVAAFPLSQRLGGGMTVWDLTASYPDLIGEIHDDNFIFTYMTFSPDGHFLATATEDNGIQIWNFRPEDSTIISGADIKVQSTFQGTAPIVSLTFSPDGKQLITSDDQDTIIFWDWATGQRVGQPLKGYSVKATTMMFGGNTLISASDDGRVILWDPLTRLPLDQLMSSDRGSFAVAFSSQPVLGSNQTLAVGGPDGTLTLWNLDVGYWKTYACQHVSRNLSLEEWEQYFGGVPYHQTCTQTRTVTPTPTLRR